MKWKKLGIIFTPENSFAWMQSHAQLPVADHVKDDLYRIYFASRDKNHYSHIGSFDIDVTQPKKILSLAKKPLLSPGAIGFFDEHGVYPSSIISVGKRKLLYYIGWNKGFKEPLFYASIGIAQSNDDGGDSFKKLFNIPILTRGAFDPCLVTSPCVFRDKKKWHMVYVSGFKWQANRYGLQSFYDLKYAYSKDGIQWERQGKSVIPFSSIKETNIGRASIIHEEGIFKMWFCYAGSKPYRIGYAQSVNGVDWVRNDKDVGIDVSRQGFDDEMICYPFVFVHRQRKYMLYNGNDNGRAGIGMAILDDE